VIVRRVVVALSALVLVGAALAPVALADAPTDALKAAVGRTAAAKTGRVAVVQRTTVGGRILESAASGVLAGGDSDLVVSGEGGNTRRVSVGTQVKERRPDPAGPWRPSTRPAPTQATPFAGAVLKDGTSIGDPKLYRSVTDAGTETLPQGVARKLVGDLDMAAVATAMQLSTSDVARMAQWKATLTFWISPDGRVARNALAIVIPSATGATTTLDVSIDLSDLDAPLVVTLP